MPSTREIYTKPVIKNNIIYSIKQLLTSFSISVAMSMTLLGASLMSTISKMISDDLVTISASTS